MWAPSPSPGCSRLSAHPTASSMVDARLADVRTATAPAAYYMTLATVLPLLFVAMVLEGRSGSIPGVSDSASSSAGERSVRRLDFVLGINQAIVRIFVLLGLPAETAAPIGGQPQLAVAARPPEPVRPSPYRHADCAVRTRGPADPCPTIGGSVPRDLAAGVPRQ